MTMTLESLKQIRNAFTSQQLNTWTHECENGDGHCNHKRIGENSTWLYEMTYCCLCTNADITILREKTNKVQEQKEIWADY